LRQRGRYYVNVGGEGGEKGRGTAAAAGGISISGKPPRPLVGCIYSCERYRGRSTYTKFSTTTEIPIIAESFHHPGRENPLACPPSDVVAVRVQC
jgi:hypothetical protein